MISQGILFRFQTSVSIVLIVFLGLVMPTRASAQTFSDVPANYWAYSFVEKLADSGITSGCGGGNYCPDDSVTRAQMAVFLERGINGSSFSPPAATGNVFLDVDIGDFAADFIEQLSTDGITSGCGNGNYCPRAIVTRDQMAVFLLRAMYGSGYSPPAATGIFGDVPVSYWAAGWIEQLAAEGITAGCGGGDYCPEDAVSRAQMAVFLVRAFNIGEPLPAPVIASAISYIAAYESIDLSVTPPPLEDSADFTVQIDLTGQGTFSPQETLEVRGLLEGDVVSIAAPMLGIFESSSISVGNTYALRVRRETDGQLSNVLMFEEAPRTLPAGLEGVPSTLLEVFLRELFLLDPILATDATTMRPGLLADSADTLDIDIAILDVHADAMLRALFGISVVEQLPIGFAPESSFTHSSGRAYESHGPPLLDGFADSISCLFTGITTFSGDSGRYQFSADDCLDEIRIGVRDHFIPTISDVQIGAAKFLSTTSSLFNLGSGTLIGGYAERFALTAGFTKYGVNVGQWVLTLPAVGASPEEFRDFVSGELTSLARGRLYNVLTDNLHELDQRVLAQLGGPAALAQITGYTVEQIDALSDIEIELLDLHSISERLEMLGGEFGDPDATSGGSVVEDIPNIGLVDTEAHPDPESVCMANPDFEALAIGLGFASCESFVTPFFDEVYMSTTVSPLLDEMNDLTSQLQAAGCFGEMPPDEPCDTLFAELGVLFDEFIGDLLAYENQEFHCDSGYTEFDAMNSDSRTCIWATLTYEPPGSACFSGSRPTSFDTGEVSVCTYYSRDYIQAGGVCKTNYSLVFFLGQDRCRWSDLPVSSPVAYSINNSTGDRQTLEP